MSRKPSHDSTTSENGLRLDKWLWAARFYKTRRLATEAVSSGKVIVNGQRAKPSRSIKLNDEIQISKEIETYLLNVAVLSEQRGPASVARTLYKEQAESIQEREAARALAKAHWHSQPRPAKRPNKRDRQHIVRFKQSGNNRSS